MSETPAASRPSLHVTNGDSVAHVLEHIVPHGRVLAWRDALHDGPVVAGPPEATRKGRARFLATVGFGAAALIEAGFAARDAALDRALDGGDEVVLWFEHDLYDQLQLVEDPLARVPGPPPVPAPCA